MARQVVALDIGGTNMRVAIVINNKISRFIQIPTPKTKKEFLKKLHWLIDSVISRKIKGIGIGIAGPIKNGKLMNAPNLPLQNYDLKKNLEKRYGKRVEVSNDAGCFTLAESKFGEKNKNFILLTLGTGIGGGIVIEGKSYRGTGYGAEFGHMHFGGKEWEAQWQDTRKKIRKTFGKNMLFSELSKIRDKKCNKILNESSEYLGQGIASLISALDPEVVILGGGVSESGSYFLNMIKRSVKKYSFLPKTTPIQWTKLEESGILGASLLI